MAEIRIVNPESLGKPMGQYSQITRSGRRNICSSPGSSRATAPAHRRRGRPSMPSARRCSRTSAPRSNPAAPAGATWCSSPRIWCIRRTSRNSWTIACVNSAHVHEWCISAQYPAHGRPPGEGAVPGRSADRRRALGPITKRGDIPNGLPSGRLPSCSLIQGPFR